jgi:hypothetical protein
MLNSEHSYHEAGYKCARARLQSDEASAQAWQRHFTANQYLEREEDRAEARRLFDRGYSEAQPARHWSLP